MFFNYRSCAMTVAYDHSPFYDQKLIDNDILEKNLSTYIRIYILWL